VPDNDEVTHLERLAAGLDRRGLSTRLVTTGRRPYLEAASAQTPQLNERVVCGRADDGAWYYFWSWQQPIGPAGDLDAVAVKIAAVLRPVEGQA
jgi:hypothetical protein